MNWQHLYNSEAKSRLLKKNNFPGSQDSVDICRLYITFQSDSVKFIETLCVYINH